MTAKTAAKGEAKFTPGPWEIRGAGVIAKRQIEIATVARQKSLNEEFANQRLIATAPKLYELCNKQHQALDTLLAMLIARDPNFFPSKSNVWPTLTEYVPLMEAIHG